VDALSLGDAREAVARNGAVLRALEAHVESLHRSGDDLGAAAWSQIAGEFAHRNHPGRFTSPRIEEVLARIGATLPPVPARRAPEVRRVLHVLTEAYGTGGHTKQAIRWMTRDAGRLHDVALTAPRAAPPALVEAANAIHEVRGHDLLARASGLRRLAAGYDLVALHVHCWDVVPAIAFAARTDGPPVVLLDHADHLFWLGAGVADVVNNGRTPCVDVQTRRRGFTADRSVLLPVPADPCVRVQSADEAKDSLGIPRAARVLLTIAVEHKFAPVLQPTFFDAAAAALERSPSAILVAIGPRPEHPGWPELAARFPGRVHALGRQSPEALVPVWDAADAYLDSYPFSSNTSAIEAAMHAIPVVSFAPDPEAQGMLLTNDPGFEADVVRAADPAAYGEAVAALLADPGDIAERQRAGAESMHSGDAWQDLLERLYARALASEPARPPARTAHAEDVTQWELVHHLLFAATGVTCSLRQAVRDQAKVLPPLQQPTTNEELDALCRWTGVAVGGDGIDALPGAVGELRALHLAGVLERCVVTVPAARVDAAIPVLEQALAEGEDFPLDLLTADDPAEALGLDRALQVA
jgi:glycosyltransferase involved in cell wall biosynthesis